MDSRVVGSVRERLLEGAVLGPSDWSHFINDIQKHMREAADTIERLQKERNEQASKLRGAHDAMEALSKDLTETEQDLDAALVEIERLKASHKETLALVGVHSNI